MSGSGILPRSRPVRIPTDVEADLERDRVLDHLNATIADTQRMAAKGVEGCDLLAHRLAAFRDGISAGLHR